MSKPSLTSNSTYNKLVILKISLLRQLTACTDIENPTTQQEEENTEKSKFNTNYSINKRQKNIRTQI